MFPCHCKSAMFRSPSYYWAVLKIDILGPGCKCMLQYGTKTGVIADTKYDYTALIVNTNKHIIAISITGFLTTSEIMETTYFYYI